MERQINRDYTLDGLKFLLICLVVLGHFIQGARYNNEITTAIYSVIYNFHMPLFVLLSGYFFHADSISKINISNRKILEPLIVYHVIATHSLNPVDYLFFEPSPLWYLISLMMWRYMTYLINCCVSGSSSKIVSSIILAFVGLFFINKYPTFMSIMRTLQFFPFFMIGHCMNVQIIEKLRGRVKLCSIVLVLVLIPLIFFSGPQLCAIEFCKYNVFQLSEILNSSVWGALLAKVFTALASLIICLCLISIVKLPMSINRYGSSTLFILCVHVPFYFIVAHYVHSFWLGMVLAILFLFGVIYLRKNRISSFLLYPVSSILNLLVHEKK